MSLRPFILGAVSALTLGTAIGMVPAHAATTAQEQYLPLLTCRVGPYAPSGVSI